MIKKLLFSVAAIALTVGAARADIVLGVAGPITGQYGRPSTNR